MSALVRVRREILRGLIREAESTPSVECCGLLAGRDGVISRIYPATNASTSATEYEIAPAELFQLFRQMHAEGVELMGIYHSHPRGAIVPSPRDIERAYYPDAAHFILSPDPSGAEQIRAFRIREAQVYPLTIEPV